MIHTITLMSHSCHTHVMFSCLLPVAVETTLQVMLVVLLVEAANWGEQEGEGCKE